MTFNRLILFAAACFAFLVGNGIATPCYAKKKKRTNYLRKAVSSLEKGNYENGLKYLKRAEKKKKDSRIDYYRGYALERMGECDQARTAYDRAGSKKGPFKQVAKLALNGFDERCEGVDHIVFAEPSEQDAMVVETQTIITERSAWKVFGWTSMILGGVTMASVPLKIALEKKSLKIPEAYFKTRYGCEVSYGSLGEGCDEAQLLADEAYPTYKDNVDSTKRLNGLVLGIGAGFAAVGAVTVITVAAIGPKTVTVKLDPIKRSARVAVKF